MAKTENVLLGVFTSKCIEAENTGRVFQGPGGMIYYYRIKFENGDEGEYGSKSNSQTTFVIGETYDYEKYNKVWTDSKNILGVVIKPKKNDFIGKAKIGKAKEYMSYWDKPETIYEEAKFSAINTSIQLINKLRAKLRLRGDIKAEELKHTLIPQTANVLFKLIYEGSKINEPNKEKIKKTKSALYLTLQLMDSDEDLILSFADFIKFVKHFMEIEKNISIS